MEWLAVLPFLLYLCLYAFMVWCWVRITEKAGFGSLGWISVIPPLSLIIVILLAFKEWKNG